MKTFAVIVTFPELPAAHAQHVYHAKGSSFGVAINRALAGLLKEKGIKGRRITRLSVRAEIIGEEKNTNDD